MNRWSRVAFRHAFGSRQLSSRDVIKFCARIEPLICRFEGHIITSALAEQICLEAFDIFLGSIPDSNSRIIFAKKIESIWNLFTAQIDHIFYTVTFEKT